MTSRPVRVVVAQRGAREHYMAATALERAGALAALVTDWYAPESGPWRDVLALGGSAGRRMLAARTDALPDSRVVAFRARTLGARVLESLRARGAQDYRDFLAADRQFAARLVEADLPEHDVLFLYSYAALEALQAASRRGTLTVLDQIDPGPVEFRRVQEEAVAWPQYASGPLPFPEEYFARLREEWRLADVVVANSEWTREALLAEQVPADKIEILPLAFDAASVQAAQPVPAAKLRVLWLGQVNLRKGIPYLVEAARLLVDDPVEFQVVGALQIPESARALAPANITWRGPVPRSVVGECYAAADVFVLPTVSDGFAITQLEALAHGLPVVTTPNCGRVVEDGRNGYLVPARDPQALAEALRRFVRDRQLAVRMRPACLARAREFGPDAYQARLLQIIGERSEARRRAAACH